MNHGTEEPKLHSVRYMHQPLYHYDRTTYQVPGVGTYLREGKTPECHSWSARWYPILTYVHIVVDVAEVPGYRYRCTTNTANSTLLGPAPPPSGRRSECIPPWHTATQPPIGQDPSHDQDADMLADTQAGQQQQQRQQQQH